MTFKKRRSISLCIILSLSLILSCFSLDSVYAVKSQVDQPSLTDSFASSTALSDDYCKASVSGKKMTVRFKTMIPTCEFRIALYGVNPKTKVQDLGIYVPAEPMGISSTGRAITGFTYTLDFSKLNVDDGEYFLYISRIENPEDTYESTPSAGALYKNLAFKVTDDTPKIFRYDDVIEENQRIQAIGADYDPSWYLDEYLTDIRFTLQIPPLSGIYENMTDSKVRFMRRMSDQITAGAADDYDKLLKIYEYVTGEFYYDSVAFSTHSYQYANPYNNLYRHVNKISSENSDNQGRVATTCQGFSAIFLSLARAQGIPTRFVYGHRVTSPLNNWGTENNISVRDHWWVESYVDGRWIFIDPTIGTNNTWNKNTDVWKYYGLTNYTYFDPSDEQIAVSHLYHKIYPEKRYGYLITDQQEIEKISSFLEATSNGVKNGRLNNANYSADNMKTWNDGYLTHFMGNGYGNTTQIQWYKKGYTGSADFSGFSKLKLFSMYGNALESVDISDCPSLETVKLQDNELEYADLSGCKNLKTANLTGNPLKEAHLYANKKNINITAGENGSFSLKVDTSNTYKVTVTANPNIGYQIDGIFNGNGKKLTSKSSYSMNPGWYNYEVRFKLNPNSYKYYLYEGRTGSSVRSYTLAAKKRLKALGYNEIENAGNGIFGKGTTEAVKAFQRVNGIEATGNIAEKTWKALFSTSAKARPSDEILQQITAVNEYKLSVDAQVTKGKVVLTWEKAEDSSDAQIGGYQVWKSTKADTGYSKIGSTKNTKFTNTANLKKGTRYYYKVRIYKVINGKVYYGQWTKLNIKAK